MTSARPIAAAPPRDAGNRVVEAALFALLAMLLVTRVLIGEAFETGAFSFLQPLVERAAGPNQVTTALLDVTVSTLAIWALVRTPGRGRGWTLFWLSVALLVAAVALSSWAAGNTRLAVNAGVNLLAALLAGGALCKLARTPTAPLILLAGLFAIGATTTVECLTQRYAEHAATVEQWRSYKQTLLERGIDADAPLIINYERRLASAESMGFLNHPNVTAAVLLLSLLPLLGAAIGWLRRYREGLGGRWALTGVGGLLLVGLAGWALVLTGSVAGLLTGAVMAALIGALGWSAGYWGQRPRWLALLLVGGYALLVTGAVAYGLWRDTLPHPSLAFRWNYWSAAAAAYTDVPLTGLGRENFHDAYLRYRPPISSEEVRNPHSLWVGGLVELGPLGLAALVLALGLLGATTVRYLTRPASTEPHALPQTSAAVAVALGVPLLQVMLSRLPLLAGGDVNLLLNLLLIWAVEFAAVWLITFAGGLYVLRATLATPAARWLAAGLVGAYGAWLLQGLIGFATFTPGGSAALALFAGAAAGLGQVRRPPEMLAAPQLWRRVTGPALAVVSLGALLLIVAVPTVQAETAVRRVEQAVANGRFRAADVAAHRAINADPQNNPSVPWRIARIYFSAAQAFGQADANRRELLEQAARYATIAVDWQPDSAKVHRLSAQIQETLSETYWHQLRPAEAKQALADAAGHWDAAVTHHPTEPRFRLWAAEVWYEWFRTTGDPSQAEIVRTHLRRALEIDAQRHPDDTARLRPAERERIATLRTQLRTTAPQ